MGNSRTRALRLALLTLLVFTGQGLAIAIANDSRTTQNTAHFELGEGPSRPPVTLALQVTSDAAAPHRDPSDLKRWCHWVSGLILQARPEAILSGCELNAEPEHNSRADYQVRLNLGSPKSPEIQTSLTVTAQGARCGLPLPPLNWVLSPESNASDPARRIALQVAFNNFFSVESNSRKLKEILLARGVHESRAIRLTDAGWYEDSRTGEQITFDTAFERFLEESPRNKSWTKATLQVAAVLGAGAIWYNWDKAFNVGDWEYSADWNGLRAKANHGIRFDTNPIRTNSPMHPLAGSFYYAFSRGNGLGSMEALLMSFAGSAVWELAVEYREVFSINDMIFTPVAGAAIGEAMHQIRILFERSTGTPGHKLLLTLFGGASGVDHWLSRNGAPRARKVNPRGLPDDIQHAATLYLGPGYFDRSGGPESADRNGGRVDAKLSTLITAIPGYANVGEKNLLIWDTTQSQLEIEFGLSAEQLDTLRFFVQAAWFGYHRQSIRNGSSGRLSGYSFLVGPATSYSHSFRHLADGSLDEMGIVNVLGPSLELIVFTKGVKIRMKLEASGDFAAVHGLAVSKYSNAGHPLTTTKKLLAQQDYYFAFGVTWRGQITAETELLELGVSHSTDLLFSIEGFDRYQSQVEDDFPLRDEAHFTKAWLAARLPIERLRLVLSYSQTRRLGWLKSQMNGEFVDTATEHTASIGLEYAY